MSLSLWILAVPGAAAAFYFVEGWASGWPRLVRTYPAGNEQVVRRSAFESGELGVAWQFHGTLTLGACERGLKVSTWLRRPFVVPWEDIRLEQTGGLISRKAQLVFGAPEVGRLRIASQTWDTLKVASASASNRADVT
ncbi:hypothetical protein [Phenylobacterium sp.]|uniref:hypothetical protein n=1 Tax=Phenylobacterium sp. TaxID=1871053 RepID=UPI00286E42FC|nr:hypothetical protein [Phenylobacterium sp.]